MPQGAPPNGSAPSPEGPWSQVAGIQAKLHRWAAADPGRRFDDLFNLVCDPATLIVAFDRVAGNKGANTPSVDGVTADYVEKEVGVPGFLDDLRAALQDGSFRPLPVRERKIPKPGGSGKLRKLGIPLSRTGWSRLLSSWCWSLFSRWTSRHARMGSGQGGGLRAAKGRDGAAHAATEAGEQACGNKPHPDATVTDLASVK